VKALSWHGKSDNRCGRPHPRIEHERDATIKVTARTLRSPDLPLYDGLSPTMQAGDVLGHETGVRWSEVGPRSPI